MQLAHGSQTTLSKKIVMPRRHRDHTPTGQQRYAFRRDSKPRRWRIEVDRAARIRVADVLSDGLDPHPFGWDQRSEDFDPILLGAVPVGFRHYWNQAARLLAYQ
jgi:hypothetical protein